MTTLDQNNVLTEILRKVLLIYYDKCSMIFVLAAITSLLSKYAFIFSTLIPLKIILILNSKKIPDYFPEFVDNFDFQIAIYLLCVFALVIFLLHLVLEKINNFLVRYARSKYLNKNIINKLKNNHILFVDRIYSSIADIFAYMTFIFSILIFLIFFYTKLAYFVIIYVLILAVLLFFLLKLNKFKIYFINNFNVIIALLANVCFLFSFTFIVYLELNDSGNSLLITILSLLLIRQGSSNVVSISNFLKLITNNLSKIRNLIL